MPLHHSTTDRYETLVGRWPGRVVYRYKQPFRDGSTHVVLEPLDFMFRMNGMPRAHGCAGAAIARLAALVPRPRLNLTRFHGIFAPNFKHRHKVVIAAGNSG